MNTPTQLTIEHLAAYLPYGVDKITRHSLPGVGDYQSKLMCGDLCIISKEMRLILRPLPQLTEQITHNGETFVPIQRILTDFDYDMSRVFVKGSCVLLDCLLGDMTLLNCNLEYLGYNKAQLLLSWHFDVFSLGDNGLCVYMNPDGTI